MNTFLELLKWLLVGTAPLASIIIGIGWCIYESFILPRLIPQVEIDALADEIMRRHPTNPEEAAYIEEHAAWFRSHSDDQGRWHRVRKEVRRRLVAKIDNTMK